MAKRAKKSSGSRSTVKRTATYALVVGQTIAILRTANGVSQGDLSRELGLGQSMVSRVEGGTLPMTLETLSTYALAFELTPSALLQMAERYAARLELAGVDVRYDRGPSRMRPAEMRAVLALGTTLTLHELGVGTVDSGG